MTPAEALQLPAGLELDMWIAEHVLRWTVGSFLDFSTAIDQAFNLGERLYAPNRRYRWLLTVQREFEDSWRARFDTHKKYPYGSGLDRWSYAETAPLAICRAAIRVYELEHQK